MMGDQGVPWKAATAEAGRAGNHAEDTGQSLSDSLSRLVRVLAEAISSAGDVSEVTYALHSLAFLLHSYPLQKIPGKGGLALEITKHASTCQERALQAVSGKWREILRSEFYQGSLFPIVAKLLLFRVAPDWLACFSSVEQTYLFDIFFKLAPPNMIITELVGALAPAHVEVDNDFSDQTNFSCKAVERLLVFCLFEKEGFRRMALESAKASQTKEQISLADQSVTVLAQLIASIPDKARPKAPMSLLSPQFHLSATLQFLEAAEEYWKSNYESSDLCKLPFILIGELFARFCRRGHADVVASQILSKILHHLKYWEIAQPGDSHENDNQSGVVIETSEGQLWSGYWTALMDCIKDVYAMERLVKALLLEMTQEHIKDREAYCVLFILFSKRFQNQNNIRFLFTKKVIFWSVLPICCQRWVLHFAVFHWPPQEATLKKPFRVSMDKSQMDIIRHVLEVWAEERFIQTAEMQEHSYITAAVCFSLRVMTKKDLEGSRNFLQLLLQAISRRLESPLHLVRLMAKKVALEFSLLIDQLNPLLLDEDDSVEDLSDWKVFGSCEPSSIITNSPAVNEDKDDLVKNKEKEKDTKFVEDEKKVKKAKRVLEPYDPDEVIDLQTYKASDDDDEWTSNDSESECSLEPYDLSDDESDLRQEKFPMQLRDCITNLRKGDDPDLVENALEVVEKLVRALPEELENAAPDLAHALIHVRCSNVAVEGEEETAEKKRYDALVALLACAPQTVEVFTQTLYSPHVDVSQRLLILEVMSDAAKEIATSSVRLENLPLQGQSYPRITEIDTSWRGPGNTWTPNGSGPWKAVEEPDVMVSLIQKYERELPLKDKSSRPLGKSRRWGHRSMLLQKQQHDRQARGTDMRKNNFVLYAPAFMLPVMRDYDKKKHGVDLIERDFIVLGRLICMLGTCIECVSLQPEAFILSGSVLNMLRAKPISSHPEAYVRRAILYAISRIVMSLHPSHVMSAINGGDDEIAAGLDWTHTWALKIAEDDTDHECSSMAMACLHLHSELLLQASRVVELQHGTGGNISYKHEHTHKISLF